MKTVDIPDGTACLREKSDIKNKHQRLVQAAAVAAAPLIAKLPQDVVARGSMTEREVMSLGASRHEVESLFELQDATIIAVLDSWTLPQELPTMDTLGDLDPDLYQALSNVCAPLGSEITTETFSPPDPRSSGFEASPTVPSPDLSNTSRVDEGSSSTDAQ
jgi:hypothetical protein